MTNHLPSASLTQWAPLCAAENGIIPAVSERHFNAANEFFSQPRLNHITHAEQQVRCLWRYHSRFPAACTVLQADNLTVGLYIEPSLHVASENFLAWWNYGEDMKLLAWTLQYECVIQIMQVLFDLAWQPVQFSSSATMLEAGDQHCLTFQFTGTDIIYCGQLILNDALLERLVTTAAWQPSGPLPPFRRHLTTKLSIRKRIESMFLRELRQFEIGDILLTGTHYSKDYFLTAAESHLSWLLVQQGDQFQVIQPNNHISFLREYDMPDVVTNAHSQVPINAPDTTTPQPLDQLPIDLQFELGQLEFTLKELEKVQPGYVFALPMTTANTNVRLLANGHCFGRGELVTIGQQLGIRLLELYHDGF